MAANLAEQLKAAPTLTPTAEDPFAEAPRGPRGGRRGPSKARARREQRVPFGEQASPDDSAELDILVGPPRTVAADPTELEMKVKILWDEYEERQRAASGPKTMRYRCIAAKPDGAICGEIVEAGTHEERVRTGEIVRCPHGPDDPVTGMFFDRERFPKYHYDLTPMEPIW